MKKNIFLIRHCQAEGQEADAPLTEKGYNQAIELSSFLNNITVDQIISSPYLRARQSIEPFAKVRELEIQADKRLSERILSANYLPDWLYKLKETFYDMNLKLEGGEASSEAQARIVNVIEEVLVSDIENTIIVTHGNIMSLLLKHYQDDFGFEQWKSLSNPDVFLLQFANDEYTIHRIWKD
ncbi:histidine phosphatase family protein [Psychrobacillus sp. FJAT-51614]|uniref:Histidine phosphatase family protein n=1 Tax=Psychrobacillus mangrovi TaxID=3117745 RepID=A0ABU8F6C8_9BACI